VCSSARKIAHLRYQLEYDVTILPNSINSTGSKNLALIRDMPRAAERPVIRSRQSTLINGATGIKRYFDTLYEGDGRSQKARKYVKFFSSRKYLIGTIFSKAEVPQTKAESSRANWNRSQFRGLCYWVRV
jgi:hypothetical protein